MRLRSIFGRLASGSRSLSTRKLLLYLSCILLLSVFALVFVPSSLSSSSPSSHPLTLDLSYDRLPKLSDYVSNPITKISNTFKSQHTHKPPPVATNSTASAASWFSNYRWLNPFSSTIALDEERTVLPPLEKRCPMYTYYDSEAKGTEAETEDKILLAWRRAYWAHGFKPIILGKGEAKQHGLYEKVMMDKFEPEFEREVMRWLAWSHMGRGILVDYRVFPMASYDDIFLSSLRRCDFAYLSRYEKFDNLLFAGDKPSIDAVLKHITNTPIEKGTLTMERATASSKELFHIEHVPTSLAEYTPSTVKDKYSDLKYTNLPALINAHLHFTFLSSYPDGITLLAPSPEKLTALHHPALVISTALSACPSYPQSQSCPPNNPRCTLCKKEHMPVSSPSFTNTSSTFLISTVPHPLTLTAVLNPELSLTEDSSMRFIRRHAPRDAWIHEVTARLIKAGVGTAPRVVQLKSAIAGSNPSLSLDKGGVKGIWTTAERGFEDVDWKLGFTIPSLDGDDDDKDDKDDKDQKILPAPNESQRKRLDQAHRDMFSSSLSLSKKRKVTKLMKTMEAWSLGDTEVWKFTTAYSRRAEMEREGWSSTEKGFGRGLDKGEKGKKKKGR